MHSNNNTSETAISVLNLGTLKASPQVIIGAQPSAPIFDNQGYGYIIAGGKLISLSNLSAGQPLGIYSAGSSNLSTPSPAIGPTFQYIYVLVGTQTQVAIHEFSLSGGVVGGDTSTQHNGPWQLNDGAPVTPTGITIGHDPNGVNYLYVATGVDASQAHVFTLNLSNYTYNNFYVAANGCNGAGMWSLAGPGYDPVTNKVFVATSNGGGTNCNWDGNVNWSSSVLALYQDGSKIAYGYAPSNHLQLDKYDWDLGVINTLSLPPIQGTEGDWFKYDAVQTGKDGVLRLLDRFNLTVGTAVGTGGEINVPVTLPSVTVAAGTCGATAGGTSLVPTVRNHLTSWTNPNDGTAWIFVNPYLVAPGNQKQNGLCTAGLYAYQIVVTSGFPQFVLKWNDTSASLKYQAYGGGAVVANGLVYYSDGSDLVALDVLSGQRRWTAPGSVGGHQTPVVYNGTIYWANPAAGGALQTWTPVGGASYLNDLALGQAAYESSNPFGGTANRGTDGNVDGLFADNSVFHTGSEANTIVSGKPGGPYWYVDLGSVHHVGNVVLYNRTDMTCADSGSADTSCAKRLGNVAGGLAGTTQAGFWINYWNGSQWVTGSDQSGTASASPAQPMNGANSASNSVLSIPVDFNTEYVMVQKASSGGDNYLHLAEVQVFGTPGQWLPPTGAGTLLNSPGSLSAYSASVYGIGGANDVYAYNFATGAWNWTDGVVNQLSVGANGSVWAVTNGSNVGYTCASPFGSCINAGGYCAWQCNWSQPNGFTWSQVAAGDGQHVWALDSLKLNAYESDGIVPTNGYSYDGTPFTLMYTWPSNNPLSQMAVGGDGDVWFLSSHANLNHRLATGALAPISGPSATVNAIAVADANDVWVATSAGLYKYLVASGSWERHCTTNNACPNFETVSAGPGGEVWALDSAGNTYRVDPLMGSSLYSVAQVPGTLTQISSGGPGDVWGINSAGTVFTFQ